MNELKTPELAKVMDKNASYNTNLQLVIFMKLVFKYAEEQDYALKNYARFVKVIGKSPADRDRFSDNELDLLWDNVDDEVAQILLICAYTGMRIDVEMLSIKIKNVHLDERYILIEKSKTDAGVRYLPLHTKIVPLIEKWYNRNKDGEWLFTNRRGNKLIYGTYYKWFEKFRDKHNLEKTTHETRHTWNTILHLNDVPEAYIKAIIGHKNGNEVNLRYTHLKLNDMLEKLDKIAL
jgi:integrase